MICARNLYKSVTCSKIAAVLALSILFYVLACDDNHVFKILTFTIWQATLSTLVSMCGGWLLARLMFSRQWSRAEKWLMMIMITPTISVAIGYMNLFVQFDIHTITGLTAIIICHCFFNVPLAALLITKGYQQIPPAQWQLAQLNRMTGLITLRRIEMPLLKAVLINSSCLIFAYCFASFSIPLLIGGGPQANTITVALYYSLITQGQVDQAMWLLVLKLCISIIILVYIQADSYKTATHQYKHHVSTLTPLQFSQTSAIVIVSAILVLLLPPLFSLIQHFLQAISRFNWQAKYTTATCNSLWLATLSSVITLSMVALLLSLRSTWRQRLEKLSYTILMIPSFVLGYTLIKLSIIYKITWFNAPTCLIMINCIISLPTVLKILNSAWSGIHSQYKILLQTSRLPLPIIWRLIMLPLMAPALRISLVLIMSYCLSDISSILLFDQYEIMTLPSLIYDAGNRFDHQTSCLLSGLLMIITFIIFIIVHKKWQFHVTAC